MRTIISVAITILLESYSSYSQIESVIWQTCLGAEEGINWTETVEKTDSGYMFGIYILNDGPGISNYHGGADAWIVNTDEYGNVLWERCYGGSSGDGPHKIMRIDDSTYYLFNHASSIDGDVHNFQGKDFWMVKIKDNGEIIWEKNFGGSVNGEIPEDAIVMPDKGALMMGRISSSGGDITDAYGDMDVWLCRIDSVGNIIWQKTIGNFGKDNGLKIKLSSHNTILFIGGHEVTGGMIDCPDLGYYIDTDVWFVEMDTEGNFINQWCYGGKYYDLGYDIIEVDDGYLIAASTRSNDRDVSGYHGIPGESDYTDIWILKIDFWGNLIWQKCLGGYSWDDPEYITETADSGFIVIGYTNSHDGDVTGNHTTEWNDLDIWVVKLNNDGQLVWEHCFGGLGTDRFWGIHCVLKKDDYDFVIGANSNYASDDVTCDLFPNDPQTNAWLFEIKDCNYYAPQTPTSISGPDTLCSVADPISSYSIYPAQWAAGYEWKFEPENAGTISYSDTTAQITWNPQFEGTVEVFARSTNDCGYSAWSEPFVTQVYTCMEIGEQGGGEAGRQGSVVIWPNPASGVLSVKCLGLSEVGNLELIVYDIFGKSILPPPPAGGEGQGGGNEGRGGDLDVSALPPGIYFISVLQDGKRIATGKFIVSR
jgi:hypothetical protein